MTLSILTRADIKYALPAQLVTDVYTEERNGQLYLVAAEIAFLCDAIVSIEIL